MPKGGSLHTSFHVYVQIWDSLNLTEFYIENNSRFFTCSSLGEQWWMKNAKKMRQEKLLLCSATEMCKHTWQRQANTPC